MTDLLKKLETARESGDWNTLMQEVPYARFLGLSIEFDGGEPRTRLRFDPKLIGNPSLPALHGGTTGALLESAAIFQLLYAAETALYPKTISLTVDYLRPAKPMDVVASATVTRHGKRVANVRVEAWQEDRSRPVATAHAHFLVM